MRTEDMLFILVVCAFAVYVATVMKFKEQGANLWLGVILSPTIPFIMVYVMLVVSVKLLREITKGISLREKMWRTFRFIKVAFSSIPTLHTICVSVEYCILDDNSQFSIRNNPLATRLYSEIERVVVA